jgi:hypothetical protein
MAVFYSDLVTHTLTLTDPGLLEGNSQTSRIFAALYVYGQTSGKACYSWHCFQLCSGSPLGKPTEFHRVNPQRSRIVSR